MLPIVSSTQFVSDLVALLQRIPELVADLAEHSPNSILPYMDVQPKENSVGKATYALRPGTVLVVYRGRMRGLAEGGMTSEAHLADLYLKALTNQSTYKLLDDIWFGVPNPGDGNRWYECQWTPGVSYTNITNTERETNSENIDIWVIHTETYEA